MNTQLPPVWLGTEHALFSLAENLASYNEHPERYAHKEGYLNTKLEDYDSAGEFMADQISSKYGNVGVISVSGPLSQSTSMMNLLFGGVGYDAVTNSVSSFYEDESVDGMILLLDSPGGAAAGLEETANLISEVSKQKPIHAYVSGAALSAAYWLGTSAKTLSGGRMSETGSIGAISTFTSIAKAMESEGVETFVARSGKYKALLHPREMISEEGKQMLLDKTKFMHGLFVEQILKNRPQLAGKVQSSWAEGQTFFAEQAIDVGLMDGPTSSLSNFFARIAKSHEVSSMTIKSKPILLSESARAALQAGAALPDLKDEGDNAALSQEQAPAATLSDSQETAAEASDKPTEKPAEQPATELKAEAGDTLVTFLQASLKERDEKLELLSKDKFKIETKLETLTEVEGQLRPIAVQACQRMQVALGQTQSSFEGFTTAALAGEYSSLQKAFNERYPAGRQSVSEQKTETETKDPMTARLKLIHGVQ